MKKDLNAVAEKNLSQVQAGGFITTDSDRKAAGAKEAAAATVEEQARLIEKLKAQLEEANGRLAQVDAAREKKNVRLSIAIRRTRLKMLNKIQNKYEHEGRDGRNHWAQGDIIEHLIDYEYGILFEGAPLPAPEARDMKKLEDMGKER